MKPFIRFLRLTLSVMVLAACGEGARADAQAGSDTAATAARLLTEIAPPADTAERATAPGLNAEPVEPSAGPLLTADTAASQDPPPAQQEGVRLLEGAAGRYSAIRSMRANFAMEARNPLLRESILSRGELFQRRPDRILLRFADPAGDIIVSDGRNIWVWYPSVDSAQVVRTPAASGAGGVDLLAQFVGDPTERFRWSVRGAEAVDGHESVILVLDPRGQEAYRQLVVWIARTDFLVRRFEVTEHSGLVRRIDLLDLVINPDLPDTLFRFVPPVGARIVGQP